MSDGFCDFSIEGDSDADTPEFYNVTTPRARKSHRCEECGEHIEPGIRYHCAVGKWDGHFYTSRLCLPCVEATAEFVEGAAVTGEFWREMRDNWESGAHLQACLNRLVTATAKEHMRRQWMKWKGLSASQAPVAVPPQENRKRRFKIGDAIRYKPGFGTYGYEDSLEADGRVPGVIAGFTRTRVRVVLAVQCGGIFRKKAAQVDAASLRFAEPLADPSGPGQKEHDK